MKNEQLTNEKKKTISKLESQRKEYRKKADRAYHKWKEKIDQKYNQRNFPQVEESHKSYVQWSP